MKNDLKDRRKNACKKFVLNLSFMVKKVSNVSDRLELEIHGI